MALTALPTLPTPHVTASTWAEMLNAALQQLDTNTRTLDTNLATVATAAGTAQTTATNASTAAAAANAALPGKANVSHTHPSTDITSVLGYTLLPAGTTITVLKAAGTWPARPTSRADLIVRWKGADPSPAIVTSGTGGMMDGVDVREIPAP